MLFLVHMRVELPPAMPPAQAEDIKAREKAYSQQLQQEGVWPHLWRVVGEYANYSVFDAPSNDALHQMLVALPLFAYMRIHVTPLAKHPSSIC
jgi:muconolactone D-isomerase